MTGEPRQLKALAAISDMRSGPPKVDGTRLLLTQLPPGSEFQWAFILFTIGMLLCPTTKPTTSVRQLWSVVDVDLQLGEDGSRPALRGSQKISEEEAKLLRQLRSVAGVRVHHPGTRRGSCCP